MLSPVVKDEEVKLKEHRLRSYLPFLAILALWVFALTGSVHAQSDATIEAAGQSSRIYMPLVLSVSRPVTPSPFAIETTGEMRSRGVQTHAASLGASWIRINLVSWRAVKPNEGDSYNAGALAYFEGQLLAAVRLGLTPIVVVDDSPRWATIGDYSCGAIHPDRYVNFGNFMAWLVQRYGRPPYNVHYWELGNEPDVDPEHSGLLLNNVFGCWGDVDDAEYFGGDDYGRMLNVVTPRIKEADPQAKVLIGGLLLANPNSPAHAGRPEYFLRGILSVPGAANNFDIVAYHAYTSWVGESGTIDSDLANREWGSRGGLVVGKAHFLREEMARYGVNKPLWLNEAGYMCHNYWVSQIEGLGCDLPLVEDGPRTPPPPDHYWQLQADHLVRMGVRTVHAGVEHFSWYTLNGPGWNQAGLLNREQNPRPSYHAYKQLVSRTLGSNLPPASVPYGGDVEAYRFSFPQTTRIVDVAWSRDATPDLITVPQDRFVAAYSRDGALITPEFADGAARFNVGFSPIYIHRQP